MINIKQYIVESVHFSLFTLTTALLLTGCSDFDMQSVAPDVMRGDVINVGGIETAEMTVESRAGLDAEDVSWLVQPLKNGLDITYGLTADSQDDSREDVAILKLTDESYPVQPEQQGNKPAEYTFKYRADRSAEVGSGNDAIWYNNGFHYFQGVHVPDRIRYNTDVSEVEGSGKAPGLTSDQHDATATGTDAQLGNYTLLAHYLGMPANYKLTATVERIKLPFRHRLARVVAFVLIDPELNTTLKGYKKDAEGNAVLEEDPITTSIRFNNVKVLQGVHDVEDPVSHHHTLTPYWGSKVRKVIPHFDGERGSYSYKTQRELNTTGNGGFLLYTKESNGKHEDVYPTSSGWDGIRNATPDSEGKKNGYTEVNYGKVPVYDIIVRPTYTSYEHVMYDEAGYDAYNETALRNIANNTNSIDFEIELENGLRYEKTFDFDLNANYQTVVYLRISREKVNYDDAGSEIWVEERKTDAWYGVDNENGNTLSKAGSSWQRAYRTTTVSETAGTTSGVTDGDFYNNTSESVGQYLGSASKWTELLLQACEGGEHHGDYFVLDQNISIDARQIPAGFVFTGHLDAQDHTITLTNMGADTYEETKDYTMSAERKLYTYGASAYHEFAMPAQLFIYHEEVAQAKPSGKTMRIASENIEKGDGMMEQVHPTLTQVMGNDVVYYTKSGSVYTVWNPRSWTFYTHRLSSGSLFCGLNGTYTTRQETAPNPYAPGFKWEANVHKERNNIWVPTPGYRAEVLNAVIQGGTLFPVELPHTSVTGNVQNCFNNTTAVTNTPNIPQYK